MKRTFLFTFLFLASAFSHQSDYQYLDELALQAGADKASKYHNYTEVYARYFSPLKNEPIKFLEIGLHKGASVKLWESYFRNADLHFIDITFQNIEYHSHRSHYHLVNQEDPAELQAFIQKTGGHFDIIIDDGGHTMQQQIISFQQLFPHLRSGGMYVIEDLHTSYWREFGGGNHKKTTVAFLKGLIDDVNYVGYHTKRANHKGITPSNTSDLTYYRQYISSLHFYDSMVVIFKR